MGLQALSIEEKIVSIPIEELRGAIRGRIIAPPDSEYDEARKIWNGAIDRKPAAIVQCKGTADVIHAVQFAKKYRLLLSVRGAGHNIAGKSLKDNVLLIDLSKMRAVHVDLEASTMTVEPGATLADVDHESQIYGLATPLGINSTTGISGLTLGGGFGWLSRRLGMTVDNLLSLEVITVDGKRLFCDKNHNADLFWAFTGGGGNFGIITSFKFKVFPVGPEVFSGPIIFPIEDAKKVLQNYREFCKSSSDEIAVWGVIRNAPPFPFIDPSMHGKLVLILVAIYTGSRPDGEKSIRKILDFGKPLGHGLGYHPYKNFQQSFDPLLTPGSRNYWKSHNFIEITDPLIDKFLEYAKKLPSPQTEIFCAQVGGAVNRVSKEATAYPHRDVEFVLNVHTRWEKPEEDQKCISWARDFYNAAKPFATGGVYMNFVSEGDENIQSAYGENIQKLAKIKTKYDPENVLRSNINIKPS